MKRQYLIVSVLSLALCFAGLILGFASAQGLNQPKKISDKPPVMGSNFTYQGRLMSSGEPVNNSCDMIFSLYDSQTGGNQIGDAITTTVTVSESFFTADLDFGSSAFNGDERWLAVQVKCPGDALYADLGRQELTATPYALYAVAADDSVHAQSSDYANDSDMLDGLHGSSFARISRYYMPAGGNTVEISIPHYEAFQITIAEAFGYPDKVSWLSGIENDGKIAWVGIKSDGIVVTGTASLGTTDTIMTIGTGITLTCPGTGEYKLILTSTMEDAKVFVIW